MPTTVRASRAQPKTRGTAEPAQPNSKPLKGRIGLDGKPTPVPSPEMLSLSETDSRVIDPRIGLVRAVRQIRKGAGLTQIEVARRLEVSLICARLFGN